MILKGMHHLAHGLLKAAGFKWELRRNGDLKIGLWKKRKRHPKNKSFYPKRFVFIPGFGDTPLSWLSVFTILSPVLGSEFDEVVLLDFPGYAGFLSKEKSYHSMDLLISAIHDVFNSLRPHTIMGHSLGGWLATQYAETLSGTPNYAGPETLILVSPAGVFADDKTRGEWEVKFIEVMNGKGFAALRPHLFAKEPRWFKYFSKEFAKFATKEEVTQFMRSIRKDHDVQNQLGKIKSRIFLVWGDADTLHVPRNLSAWLAGLNEREVKARGVLIKDAGHSPQVERPMVTAAVIAEILGSKKIPVPTRLLAKRYTTIVEPKPGLLS